MPTPLPRLLCGILISLAALLGTSCSRHSSIERALTRADTHYNAGSLDSAEVEYLNTIKLDPANVRAIVQLAMIYAEQGRLSIAPAYLFKARELQPENLEIRSKLAVFFLNIKKFSEARTEIHYILDHQPNHPEAPFLLAESAQTPDEQVTVKDYLQKLSSAKSVPVLTALANLELRQHKLAEGETLLLQAHSLDPKSATVNASLGAVSLAKNDLPSAETAFASAWQNAPVRSPMKLSYVRFKLQTGDIEGAKRLLNELTALIPDTLPPMMLLADICIKEKKYDQALALTEKIITRDPFLIPALLLSARLRLIKGETDKTLQELAKIKRLQPKNPELYYLFAQAYLAQGEESLASANLHQAIEIAPAYFEAIILQADLNLKKGDARAAIAALKPLLTQRPDNPPAKLLLARANVSQGDLPTALTIYQEISAASPKEAHLLIPIALILRQQKEYTEARKILAHALELVPDFGPAIELLVDLDLIAGNPTGARIRAEDLKAKQPDKIIAYLLLAKINLTEKNFSQAEKELLKVIELQPDTTSAYYLLAGIYTQTHQTQKALAQLEQVALTTPKNPSLFIRIALLQEQLNNFPAARDAYEKVLTIEPRFVTALNNLAYLYAAQLSNNDRALTLAQQARELAPTHPNIADTLGWILYHQGQYQRARALLLESATKLPEEALIQFHLGMAHYMMGETELARINLQQAQRLNPALPENSLINQRLTFLENIATHTGRELRTTLEQAITAQKNDIVALTQLGSFLIKIGELDQAQANLNAALAINPLSVNASLGIIQIHLARHETNQALDLAKAIRKQAPDDASVAHQLGRIAYQMGEYQWASSLLRESARKLPDDFNVLFDQAKAAYSIGRVADAEEAMRRILQTKPEFADTVEIANYLEMIALKAQPTPEGSAKIDQVLKNDPTFVPALMAFGATAEKQLNPSAARQAYEKALAKFPDFIPAKKSLALLAAAADAQEPQAYELAIQAREALPNDPEIAQALGILTYRKGDFNRAASLLKESISRLGEDARRAFYLGLAQNKLMDKSARATLQRSLALGLKDEAAVEANRLITELK